MKTRWLAPLLAALISAPVAAQNEPSEVTDAEIAKYKTTASNSCRDAGAKQGDPKEKVDGFCGCVIDTLTKSMTRGEWQQASFYSLKGQAADERKVLQPHLQKVSVCAPAPAPEQQAETPDAPAKAPAAKPQPKQGLKPPAAK